MRYINGGIPVSRDTFEAQLLPTLLETDERRPALGFHAAVTRDRGDFLGWVSLRITGADPREAELGYRFQRTAWGAGYATEAARALINEGFADPEVDRIVATTYQDNVASQRVMQKLGMTLRRRFRPTPEEIAAGGTSHHDAVQVWPGDDVEYALDRADWKRDREP